ncbi:MAG: hypothetical protein GX309_04590 [Clostridiales bacterium]|nr:hypothetical protein [Clostridiales bacterium]
MSFYDWCVDKYEKPNTLEIKFIEAIRDDIHFPKKSVSKIEILAYLLSDSKLMDFTMVFRRLYEREYSREFFKQKG